MANANKPTGLSPVRYLNGAPWNGAANVYYIPQADTNAYAIGDPVATHSGAADSNGVSAVTLATAGASNASRGVIVGIGRYETLMADPSNLDSIVIPATKGHSYYVMVVDDPMVLFEIQEYSGSGSTNFTSADIGKTVNLKAGANNGFLSGWTLNDTVASSTSSTGQVKLMGISRRTDNSFGSYCKFLCLLNQHELKAATAGV